MPLFPVRSGVRFAQLPGFYGGRPWDCVPPNLVKVASDDHHLSVSL